MPFKPFFLFSFSVVWYLSSWLGLNAQNDSNLVITADTVVFISKKSIGSQLIHLKTADFKRLPGGFDDPSRVLLHFPGIAMANDQANGILYHGLPSHLTNWRLNGLDIVNPNHLSNAGTLSDLASPSAGGVNMFSANVLDGFQFISPALTGQRSWALGGIADLQASSDRQNYLQLSVLGLEAGLHKKWKDDTHAFVNYRYSFTGLLDDFGVALGNEAIRFDDLVAGISGRSNNFKSTVLLAAGRSDNQHNPQDEPYLTFKDGQNIHYTSNNITSQWLVEQDFDGGYQLDFGLSFSQRHDKRTAFGNVSLPDNSRIFVDDRFDNVNRKFTAKSTLHTPQGYHIEARFMYDHLNFEQVTAAFSHIYQNQTNNSLLINTFKSLDLTPRLRLSPELGILYQKNLDLLPGLGLEYLMGSHSFKASFTKNAGFGLQQGPNDLKGARSLNYMLDYKITTARFRSSLSAFYHGLYHLAADSLQYNYLHGFDFNVSGTLNSSGLGKSEGISMMVDFDAGKGWWLNLNHSWLSTKYKNKETENWQHAENDFGWMGNSNVGKKMSLGSGTLSLSLSCHYRGGQYYFNIKNDSHLNTRDYSSAPQQRFSPYIRWDARINYTWKKSMLSLDIQNVANRLNDGYLRQGPEGPYIEAQLGLIPVLSYKRNW